MLVYATTTHVHPLAVALALATIVLVLLRTALTFRENTRLLEHSVFESLTDSLTGIANRRKLVSDLEDLLAEATGEDRHLLVIFDLNGFKDYNDAFGHPAGDALLARLAAKLRAAVERAGRVYRLGRDEVWAPIPPPEPPAPRRGGGAPVHTRPRGAARTSRGRRAPAPPTGAPAGRICGLAGACAARHAPQPETESPGPKTRAQPLERARFALRGYRTPRKGGMVGGEIRAWRPRRNERPGAASYLPPRRSGASAS